MNLFTFFNSKNLKRLSLVGLLVVSATISNAQFRSYSKIYSDNTKGNTVIFGNTLMAITKADGSVNLNKMNDNSANGNSTYGNDNENMQYIDLDGASGNGSVTRNSSTSDLVLPAGTNTIKFARLYWGGRVLNTDFDLTQTANKKVKIRKGTSAVYADVTALQIDTNVPATGYTQYQAYADITSYITTSGGAGTYEVGNAPLTTGSNSSGGNYGAWCIVVVYENSTLPYNSIRLYDGFEQVYNGGNPQTSTVNLTGLDVPSGALSAGDASLAVVAWEGDANLKKDFMKINGAAFSNALNAVDNPWNGTISNNGVHVTTKNPNYTNQMGIDIDQFDVSSYGIAPNATSVSLEFGTEADQYFPGLFSFVIKMKDPNIALDKMVSDASGDGLGQANEVLTYTLNGTNTGSGNANSIEVTDTLPNTITYVPGSLKVLSSPGITAGLKTDASGDDVAEYIVNGSIKTVRFRLGTGATSALGGKLATGETFSVQFKATVNNPGSGNPVPSIINTARMKAISDAGISYVDDGTAIINPDNGPLPVVLRSFSATLQSRKVRVDWVSSQEINCSKYDVERSTDGHLFSNVSTLPGNGTTSIEHTYSILDDVESQTAAIVYYRLKQTDLDGKSSYSRVVAVKLKGELHPVSVSPNPFTSYLNVNLGWSKAEVVSAKVYNVQGKEVSSKTVQMVKGTNYIKLDDLSNLPSGNYIIQFISGDERVSEKITKQ
ncbi:MAG: T9SS type A sorting domain-containing protein [Chitinophagaceae bacterium]|nr:T9SS type A sorting domain-containing protein [Chitinophagaceae bacterium]